MSQSFRILPKTAEKTITASVGVISPRNNQNLYVVIRNERGWDIPGGHVESNETPLIAFKRELFEEAGCTLIDGAELIAILESTSNPETGIAVYRGLCSAETFTPNDEIYERKFMTAQELVKSYFGDKNLLIEILNLAI